MTDVKFPVIPLFSCHSRENGNPEPRMQNAILQIPHQVMSPRAWHGGGMTRKGLSRRNFYCHSRENGNPDFGFRIKCGMTE